MLREDTITINDLRNVYVVWGNTDMTEGRGFRYPLHVTETQETAYRLARRNYVMGSDCPVTQVMAFRIDHQWYAPVRILPESVEDAEGRRKREAKQVVIARAKAAGLSETDIETLMR